MTVETPETMDEKELLDDFKSRYTKLRDENQQLVAKVKEMRLKCSNYKVLLRL